MAKRTTARKTPKLKITVTKESRLLHRLGEIGATMHSSADALRAMLDEFGKATGIPVVAVELYNEATQAMQFQAIRGIELMEAELELQMPVEFALSGTVVQTNAPLVEKDPERAGDFWISRGMKSYFGFPMTAAGRCVGTLSLAHPDIVDLDTAFEKCAAFTALWMAQFVEGQLFRQSGEPAGVMLQKLRAEYEEDLRRLNGLLRQREIEHKALSDRIRAATDELQKSQQSQELLRKQGELASSEKEELNQLRREFDEIDKQLHETQQALRSQSMQDEQTSLPNGTLFRYLFAQTLARSRRQKEMLGLLYIDLDNFQEFRMANGDSVADNVLKQIAERLRRNVREGDSVSRVGLDEFVWTISNLQDMEDLAIIAEKMLAIARRGVPIDGRDYSLTTSIGISVYPFDGGDVDVLLQQATTALIRAKELGRDTYQFYSEDVNSRLQERLVLKQQLHDALSKHQFVLHYQPVLSVAKNVVEGVEVLLRWKSPDGKLAYPGDFLRVSEETGLIAPLDEWVLRNACEQMKRWSGLGRGGSLLLAVNISQKLFQQIDFPVKVAAILRDTGFPANRLELEVTEKALANDIERSIMTLRSLKDLGVRVAIDDFGTGELSLSRMKNMQVFAIKLDPVFTRNLPADSANASMVTGILSMARAMGLKTVAEGVEFDAELQFLRGLKCDFFQGHLFRPAVPAESITELLQDESAEFEVDIPLEDGEIDLEFDDVEETMAMPSSFASVAFQQQKPGPAGTAAQVVRSVMAKNYVVTCCNCRNQFDAMETPWCSCLVTERTLVCPHCMDCFCKAPLEFKLDFWTEAPQSMWDRRVLEESRHSNLDANPSPEDIKRPLVLVLDDERPILSMAAQLIGGLGYGVVTGSNGEDGLALAREYKPDVILSDALMPKMDGREMCRKIKTDPQLSAIKVIIMTSLSTRPRDRSTAFKEFRMDEYLQKPLPFNRLRKVLDKLLHRPEEKG